MPGFSLNHTAVDNKPYSVPTHLISHEPTVGAIKKFPYRIVLAAYHYRTTRVPREE